MFCCNEIILLSLKSRKQVHLHNTKKIYIFRLLTLDCNWSVIIVYSAVSTANKFHDSPFDGNGRHGSY